MTLKFRIRRPKISEEARGYIARKIAYNLDEGKSAEESQAIAFSQARQAGYNVPPPPKVKDRST